MTFNLGSQTLSFSRDGRTVVAVAADDVSVIDTRTDSVRRIARAGISSAIGFSDQIWTVGPGTSLARWRLDGAPLGDEVTLTGGAGHLVAASVGAVAALWTGGSCAVLEDRGGLVISSAPSGDLVLPLTGRRWVVANGARVVAPSGISCELPAGARVTGGAIVLDGSAVLVVVERTDGRDLALIGLANGRLQLRHGVPAVELRASRTLIVALRVEPNVLALRDLRSGAMLGHHESTEAISDFAIDPDGRQLALRTRAGHLELLATSDAIAPRVTVVVPTESNAPPAPDQLIEAQARPPQPVEQSCAPAIARPFDLRAFGPRPSVVELDRTGALALLDLETRTVALWTLRAIAEAWDSRRLGYGNEGKHPYEHEVAALLAMNHGYAGDYLAAADEHLAAHLAAHPLRRDPTTPLGALAAELGLSSLALDVLLVVAAPALWSETARLYGILANDGARPLVDEALVAQILGPRVDRHALAAELDVRSPLVVHGAIEVGDGRVRPFAELRVNPVVLARMRREDPDLGIGLVVRGSDRSLEDLALGANVISEAATALARSTTIARIALRGRPGSGRKTLLAAFAAEANRAIGVLDTTLLPRTEREFLVAVRGGLQRAQLAGLVPCVVGLEAIAFADRSGRDAVLEVLRAHPGPLAVVLPVGESAPLDAGHIAIDLPILVESERIAVWSRALADAGLGVVDVAAVAARYRIGPGVIHRAVAAVRARPRRQGDDDVTYELDAFIRQTRDARLGAYARRVERLASWDQLVLAPDILDSLHELIARVEHRRTVFELWGMEQTMATSRGLTALFSGPPGTGKTLVAGVIANELGLDLYQVDLSKVMSKWIGETERNLGAIFDAAEDGQVILLFDEADSLFAKRTEVRSSNDRYANLEVNYLLQRLDAFEGIAILTTNASSAIDPAFKRRLSFRLSFPFPDEETREELWRAHLPPSLPIVGELALDKLAHKYHLSGGYIRNACLRAAFLAASEAGGLSQRHLERAVALEFSELGKLSSSGSLD